MCENKNLLEEPTCISLSSTTLWLQGKKEIGIKSIRTKRAIANLSVTVRSLASASLQVPYFFSLHTSSLCTWQNVTGPVLETYHLLASRLPIDYHTESKLLEENLIGPQWVYCPSLIQSAMTGKRSVSHYSQT